MKHAEKAGARLQRIGAVKGSRVRVIGINRTIAGICCIKTAGWRVG